MSEQVKELESAKAPEDLAFEYALSRGVPPLAANIREVLMRQPLNNLAGRSEASGRQHERESVARDEGAR